MLEFTLRLPNSRWPLPASWRVIFALQCFALLLGLSASATAQSDSPHVVFLVGEGEYGSAETMPQLAQRLRDDHGLRTTVLRSERRELPDLSVLDSADALVLALRFRTATDQQIERLDRWIQAGRPTIALRTTSHAFVDRKAWFPVRFGGHYKSHAPNGEGTVARIAVDEAEHPILRGLPRAFACGYGGTYDALPLSSGARVLLFGRTGERPSQPIAWTYRESSGAKLFYTSLGSREHLAKRGVRRLLTRAVLWGLGRLDPGPAFDSQRWRDLPSRKLPAGATALFAGGLEGWRAWDPSVAPRAIRIDRRADTSGDAAPDPAPRWEYRAKDRMVVARPGFGDLVSEDEYGAVELAFDFRLPDEVGVVGRSAPKYPLLGGVYFEGRYRVPVTANDDRWHRMSIAWRHDVGRQPIAEVRVDGGPVRRIEFDGPSPYGFLESASGGVEALRGLRHVYAEAPKLEEGDFAFVARFRAEGDGTLVAKAPAAGDWAPDGKTLFLRGGRLVYDIGWVGALGGGPRVDDGDWHTVALTHAEDTAVLFLDGKEIARKEDFVAEDPAEMVLKIGATSPDFGGGLTNGEIERVLVFDQRLPLGTARAVSAGKGAEREPALDWVPTIESNVAPAKDETVVVGPLRFHADNAPIEYANVHVRPLAKIDHAALIRGLDQAAFERGKKLYNGMCAACHGVDGERAINPQARAFSVAKLQNGTDPIAIYRTLTDGYKTMPPQAWMSPSQRYDVIHFLREAFLKEKNPSQYFAVDDEWLAGLPPARPQLADAAKVVGSAAGRPDDLPARDFGPALACQLGPKVPAGLAVRLPGAVTIGYDLHTMGSIGAWRGAFLDLTKTHHYQQRGEGIGRPGADPMPWSTAYGWEFGALDRPQRGPYPAPAYRFRGRHVRGRDLALHYDIHEREVLEWPTATVVGQSVALVHRFRVGPGTRVLKLRWADAGWKVERSGAALLARHKGGSAVLRVLGDLLVRGPVIEVPASASEQVFTLVRAHVETDEELAAFETFVDLEAGALAGDPKTLLGGGSRLWSEVLTTRGRRGSDELPYAVDTLPLPNDNPYGAWLRTTALDFFADGRCAVATLGGDVWIVDGIDDKLTEVRWSRFAAGLFEPLGLKVVDGLVYVTCRDGIVRLRDVNADGEADAYECFHQDVDVSATFHAFNFDLQRDADGRLSFVKSGRYTSFSEPGAVVRVAPDGSWEYVAKGFRTPNGMGILPDGSLLVSDNQGQWVPASKISRIRPGGFYGVFRTNRQEQADYDRPILWLPQDVDSSSGGQLFVDDARFGPLSGQLLHTSFGKGWCYALELQEIGEKMQASCVTLPFQFDAGIQRARVNPMDGQVYLTGLSGWQGPKGGDDGCLQRLRFTGREGTMLLGASVAGKGRLVLRFSGPVGEAAADPGRYEAEQWNYRWAARYGSDQWSVRDPEQRGHDELDVTAAKRLDGNRVELTIPGLQPADQLRIECDLPGLVGEKVLHMTVRAVPGG